MRILGVALRLSKRDTAWGSEERLTPALGIFLNLKRAVHSRENRFELLLKSVVIAALRNSTRGTHKLAASARLHGFRSRFGIELEIVHRNQRQLRDAIRSRGIACEIEGYNHSTRCHWKIVSDASVNGGYELVSPVLKGQSGLDEVKAVCEALSEVGALINKSCGFHAHFGTDDFKESISVWRNLYINYATLEEDIDAFMPPSRRRNTYCASLKVRGWREKMENARTLVELEKAITKRNRYFKLNSQSYWRHGTVEFRQHSGTIEFDKIRNWLLFCARLVELSKRERLECGGERALAKLLDRGLAAFYK